MSDLFVSNRLFITHGKCDDGFCAAWILHGLYPEAEFVDGVYGKPPPDVTGKDVIIADFSYPRDVLIEMNEKAKSLVVIDHHKTAEAELKGLDFCHFDMDHSGARLTWDYLYTDAKKRPYLVDQVEDRDMWWKRLPHSDAITAAIRSYPQTFEQWDKLAKQLEDDGDSEHGTFQTLMYEGYAILRAQEKMVQEAVARQREIQISAPGGTWIVPMVNSSVFWSEVAHELSVGRAFGVTYFQREDGMFQYSLRSGPEGADVSEVAKNFGGGGHARAAGFQLDYILPGK